ncbi:uncharacterized protein BT62DRAFT_928520 [Guyanagaster necrorhizus]|uniref:BZIP domain-containing protein n=1 Tax=Guyanagaster necrorhizus TaxID=856835 RepID=A0A9P7W083_9AGAR|nr:uncharacterized protein BT62DRAFT_928520 [Guyanagaster necrorhizus MCA 3950]KAG7449787.1 hypothetical protein BT62DRAFT_928520 [Guyanagaster necrorhizus MCA 3950]
MNLIINCEFATVGTAGSLYLALWPPSCQIPAAYFPSPIAMTRGRKKDLTIPPTRALTQQRDYRARRAQYVNDLEEKCRALEIENSDLRQEVRSLRVKLPSATVHNPQMVQASAQLMQDLSTASQTLARFQHVVFSEVNTFPPPMPISRPESGSMPSPVSLAASPSTPHATVDKNDAFSRSYQNIPRFPRDILCDRDRDNTSADSGGRLYDNESDGSHSDEEHTTHRDSSSRSYSYTNSPHPLPYRSTA